MHVLPTIETEMLGSLGSAVSLNFRSVFLELACRTSTVEPVTAVSLKFRSVLWELLCRTSPVEPVTAVSLKFRSVFWELLYRMSAVGSTADVGRLFFADRSGAG